MIQRRNIFNWITENKDLNIRLVQAIWVMPNTIEKVSITQNYVYT